MRGLLILFARQGHLRVPKSFILLTAGKGIHPSSTGSKLSRLLFFRGDSSALFFRTPENVRNVFKVAQYWRTNGRNWWERFSEKIVKSVSRRCLLCAGAIFLWDRERVTNQEVSRSLSMYERRVNGGKVISSPEAVTSGIEDKTDISPVPEPSLPDIPSDDSNKNQLQTAAISTVEDPGSPKLEKSDESTTVNDEPKKPKQRRSYRSNNRSTKSKQPTKSKHSKKMDQETNNEDIAPPPKVTDEVTNTNSSKDSTTLEEQPPNTHEAVQNINNNNDSILVSTTVEEGNGSDPMEGWTLMSEQEHCKIYSKPHGDNGLSQYKAIGFYSDITARDFLDVQVGEGRMSWDSYCLSLKTVDHDSVTGSEVIHWVVKFPFPMSDRDYVFVRRSWISSNDKSIVVISRSVEHPSVPVSRKYIRVKSFFSELVIKPSTYIDEVGFHFELTYFDDPGSKIPSTAMSWATKSALPDFLNKIYQAVQRKNVSNRHKHHLA